MLEDLLHRQDYTYEEIAARFEALAREMGESATLTPRHLRRLASGERSGTTPVTRRVLQAMFSRTASELLAPWSAAPDDQHAAVVASPKALDDNREMLEMAALRARRFTLESARSNVTGETMDQLQDDVATIARAYPQVPLNDVLVRLVETQDIVLTLLEGKQPPLYGRRLLVLATVLSGLLAKASHDLADPHAALTQSRTAYLCADNADHNGLRAWVRGLQSLIAYWAGRYHESVGYAQEGQQHDPRSTSAVWLAASEARAWAALANEEKATAALRAAEDAWDRVMPDELDELGGICTFTRSRLLYYAADALAGLPGQARTAEDYARQAVAAYAHPAAADWSFGDEAGSRTDLAIARIRGGEVEGASEALRPVLDLPADQRINGIIASVRRVHTTVTGAARSSAGTQLQEQIEVFMRTPATAGVAR